MPRVPHPTFVFQAIDLQQLLSNNALVMTLNI